MFNPLTLLCYTEENFIVISEFTHEYWAIEKKVQKLIERVFSITGFSFNM